MKRQNLSIGTRLGAGFAVVLLLTLMIIVLSLRQQAVLRHAQEHQVEAAQQLALAEQWRGQTQLNLARALSLAQAGNLPTLKAYLAPQVKETSARISELQKRLEATDLSDEEKALLKQIGSARSQYIGVRESLFKAMDAGEAATSQRVDRDLVPAAQAYLDSMTALTERISASAYAVTEAGRVQAEQTRWTLAALGALALLVGSITAWLLTRSVTQPLQRVIAGADRIAQGQLAEAVAVDRSDELGTLQQSLDRMRDNLRSLVTSIGQSTDGITTASSEIATGGQDLSRRTEETAANLERVASSMEQLSSTVKMTAASTQTANQLAASAAETAGRGGTAVGELVGNMRDISDSSRKIADIIGVIDGIAFQTNILALNAAVEAARAGEQGRGFAVVAGEVRSLASRSATAAREIKDLIGASVDKVASGVRMVESVGATTQDIVGSVQRVSDIIAEINAATSEQHQGLAQISDAVDGLDHMTQQNAALVEQSAAAAESLKDQARALASQVSRFDVGTPPSTALTTPSVSPRPRAPKLVATPRDKAAIAPARRAATTTLPAKPASEPAPSEADWATF